MAVTAFDVPWHSVDGGGGVETTAENLALTGTIGQPDAGVMSGGDFILTGGFLTVMKAGALFEDGFESGDTYRWSNTAGE